MVGNIHREHRKWKVQFKKELIIAILVLVLPFFIYAHLLFSENLQELNILFWKWEHGFKHNQLFMWNILSDFIPFCLLLIAYFTTISYIRNFFIPLLITFFYFLLSDLFYLNPAYFFTRLEGYLLAVIIIIGIHNLDKYVFQKIRINLLTFSYKDFLRELISLKYSRIIKKVEGATRKSTEISSLQYVSRLHFYSEIMERAIDQTCTQDKSGIKCLDIKGFRLMIIASLVLAFLLNFVYLTIPKELNRFDVWIWVINDLGFGSLSNLAWYALKKVSLLIVFTVWFSFSKNWWKIAIISPLMIYSYQLIEIFYEVEEIESYISSNVFPLILFIALIIIVLSRIVRSKTKMMDYLDLFQSELNKEITRLSKMNI